MAEWFSKKLPDLKILTAVIRVKDAVFRYLNGERD